MPFVKGQVLTHKRTGRRRGAAGMARDIQKRTNNGKMLVDFAMEVFENKDEQYFLHDRQWAAQFLADRGFGRPIATIELEGMLEASVTAQMPKLDLTKLSHAQRQNLREVLLRALGRPRDAGHTATGAPLQLVDGGGDDE